MTNNELQQWEEGNKLIAEFAGWVRVYPGTAPKDKRGLAQFEGPNGGYWASNISDGVGAHVWPPFHSSWDFLMPVAKKILELRPIQGKAMTHINQMEVVVSALMLADIDKLYSACIHFIIWYNINSNPNDTNTANSKRSH